MGETRPRAARWLLVCALTTSSAACGRPVPTFPTGSSTPYPDFPAAYRGATQACRDVKTITASMSLSGRAGRTKLRGRIDAGFEAPSRMRLEGLAPFGRPVFVLTSNGEKSTLVLPRDGRVLANAAPEEIVEALAGVAIGPDTLRIIVSGCGFTAGDPQDEGRAYHDGTIAGKVEQQTMYLRPTGSAWNVSGASRGEVSVFYSDYANGRPSTIRVRATPASGPLADLTLRLSQVDVNTAIDPRAFTPAVPDGAVPLTLEELRRAGPLGAELAEKGGA
jgi:outer membrane lipoprotein-sorting protein